MPRVCVDISPRTSVATKKDVDNEYQIWFHPQMLWSGRILGSETGKSRSRLATGDDPAQGPKPHFSQGYETGSAGLQTGCSEGLLALRDLSKP